MNGAPTSPAPVMPPSRGVIHHARRCRGAVHCAHAVACGGAAGRQHGTRDLSAKVEYRARVRGPQAYLNAYGATTGIVSSMVSTNTETEFSAGRVRETGSFSKERVARDVRRG